MLFPLLHPSNRGLCATLTGFFLLRVFSKTRLARNGNPFEHIVLLDLETAAAVFENPREFAAKMEKKGERLVSQWNKKNGPAEKKGKRVSNRK